MQPVPPDDHPGHAIERETVRLDVLKLHSVAKGRWRRRMLHGSREFIDSKRVSPQQGRLLDQPRGGIMVQERVGEVSIGRRQQQGRAVYRIGKHETALVIKDRDRRMELAREVVHGRPGREIRGYVYSSDMTLSRQAVEFREGVLDRMEVRDVDIEATTVEVPADIIEHQSRAS